jgi:hypothetical protein
MHEFSAARPDKDHAALASVDRLLQSADGLTRSASDLRAEVLSFLNGPLPAAVSGLPRQMETVQDAAGKVTEALKET